MATLRQIRITFNPIEAVHVRSKSAREFCRALFIGVKYTYLTLHRYLVKVSPSFYKWPIEIVTVKSCEYTWLCFTNVFEELF